VSRKILQKAYFIVIKIFHSHKEDFASYIYSDVSSLISHQLSYSAYITGVYDNSPVKSSTLPGSKISKLSSLSTRPWKRSVSLMLSHLSGMLLVATSRYTSINDTRMRKSIDVCDLSRSVNNQLRILLNNWISLEIKYYSFTQVHVVQDLMFQIYQLCVRRELFYIRNVNKNK